MPITVRAPDGTLVNFPDGMSDRDITRVMRQNYPPSSAAAPKPKPKKKEDESFLSGVIPTLKAATGNIVTLGGRALEVFSRSPFISSTSLLQGVSPKPSDNILRRAVESAGASARSTGQGITKRAIAELPEASVEDRLRQQSEVANATPGTGSKIFAGIGRYLATPPSEGPTLFTPIDYAINAASRNFLPQTPEDAARTIAKVQAPFGTSRGAAEFIASQVPASLIPLGFGKIAQVGGRAILPRLGVEISEEALAKGVGRGVVTAGGGINAASAGNQAYEDVINAGGTKEEADRAFKIAFAGAAAVSGAAARMPGLEQRVFSGEPAKGGILRSAGRAAIGEAPQEFVEEGGATLATNVAKLGTEAEVPIGEDVLSSGAMGAIGGATIAAPIGGLQGAFSGRDAAPAAPTSGAPRAPRTPPPPPPPPADMGALSKALGPVGGKITLQEPTGPQEYTYQGIDEDGSVILADADGVVFSEDPAQVQSAIKAGVAEPESGLGGMAFGMDITEGLPEVVAPPPPPPPAAPAAPAVPAAPVAPVAEPVTAPAPPPPVAEPISVAPAAPFEPAPKPTLTATPEPAPVAEEPELPPPPPERVRTVTTPGGSKVNTAFEVVDAADLTAATGDLQNRDRSRASTDLQVQDIFSNFDPERLGESLESDRGSPIVGPDNTVESGNGRVMAINKVYDESPEKADAYRKFIEDQGFDTSGLERPVLVRRRIDRMTPDQRSKFVRESNMDTKLQLSTSEKAQTDAASLTPDVMGLMASPDVSASANQGFVRAFLSKLPAQEQAAFLDKDGRLSADGIRRLRTAVKSSAYGDADLINTLDESQDNNIKSIGGALEDVAPAWRRMLDAIRDGDVEPEMDTTKQLVEAAKIVRDVRNKGMKIGDFLSQQDAFNPLDPVTERFIRSFYNESLGRAAGREAIADALDKYARRASEQTTSEGLFETEQTSPTAILDRILEERGSAAGQPSMFASIQPISPKRRREILDEGGKIPSLSRGVTKLKKLWAAGKIDAKEFAYEVASYSDFIEDAKNWKRWEDLGKLKVRGPDRIRSVLLEQKRKGNISEEEANFAEWFILRNENLLDDLGIAVRKPSEKSRSSGFYDVLPRVMYLIKGRTSDDTTVHEIMHHLERMMPQDIRMAIKRAWAKELDRVERLPYDGKNEKDALFFKAIRAFHDQKKVTLNGEDLSPSEAFKFATNLISDGSVDGRLYQYVNPSEFWAVNATEIMRGRYEVQGSLLGRLRNWLRELSIKIKGLFKLDSNAPIIKALDSLAKGDGKFVSNQMLEEKPGDFSDITPISDARNRSILAKAQAVVDKGSQAKLREVEDILDALDDVYSSDDENAKKEADRLEESLYNMERQIREKSRPSNDNKLETEVEKAEREYSKARKAMDDLFYNDERSFKDRRTKERKAFEKELDQLEKVHDEARAKWEALYRQETDNMMKALRDGTPGQMRNAVAKAQKRTDKIIDEGADLQKDNRGCD